MEKCPNCGKPMPKGMEVHDECREAFIQYLKEDMLRDHYPEFTERAKQEHKERTQFERILGDINIDF